MINEIKKGKVGSKNRICIFRDTPSVLLEAMFTTEMNEWNRSAKGFSIMNENFFKKICE